MALPLSFGLLGVGVALPDRCVPSSEIDRMTGRADGATQAAFAIAQRYWAGPDETSSSLAASAAVDALRDAGLDPGDLDVIIGGCAVMEQPIPGTATLVQQRLGLGQSGIPAFDVNATCLSFLVAFETAVTGLAVGKWQRALVFSAEIASAALDFEAPEASAIFGDGAAAVVLSADGPATLLAARMETFGDGAQLCRLEAGGTRLRPHDDLEGFLAHSRFVMDGPGVFRATARPFPGFLTRLLARAGVAADAIDTIVPHQASAAALEHLKRSLPGGHAKTVDIFAHHGNQIAASLPHALYHARNSGRTAAGTTTLMIGSSAGISLGGAVIRS